MSRYESSTDGRYKFGLWLRARVPPKHCFWCLKPLTGRQQSYCAAIVKDGYRDQECARRFHGWEYQRPNYQLEVLVRDNFTCQDCGFSKTVSGAPHLLEMFNLHVHHIQFYSNGGSSKPENLITICESCHKKRHASKKNLAQENQGILPVAEGVK